MNWRTTVVLVVVALIAIAILYFGVLKTDEGAATPTPAVAPVPTRAPLFPGVSAEQVQSLGVKTADGKALVLARGGDGVWRITQGVVSSTVTLPAPANPEQVGAAVQQLVALQPSFVLTETADLKTLGLEPPSAVVTFTATSGVTGTMTLHTLRIGKEPIAGTGYYSLKDDDTQVYVVSTSIVETLLGYAKSAPVQPTPTVTPTASATPEASGTAPVPVAGQTPVATAPPALAPSP